MQDRPLRIEVVDDRVADILRRQSVAERLAQANTMTVQAMGMTRTMLRSLHPDWDDARLEAELRRRLRHGAA